MPFAIFVSVILAALAVVLFVFFPSDVASAWAVILGIVMAVVLVRAHRKRDDADREKDDRQEETENPADIAADYAHFRKSGEGRRAHNDDSDEVIEVAHFERAAPDPY